MDSIRPATPVQARQTRQQFANPEDYLSYELGKAVRELPPLYTRIMAGTITALVVSAIAWAAISKVDEVAIAQGELVPAQQVRPVRALTGGIIRDIRVKSGDVVKQGDVLIEQDPGLPEAEVQRLEQSAALIRQDLARLEAESRGQLATGSTPQEQLSAARSRDFESRRAAATAEANRQQAIIAEAENQLERLRGNLANARITLQTAREREAGLRSLVSPENGAVPRFEYLEARDRLVQAQDQVASLEREISGQQQAIRQAQAAYQAATVTITNLGDQRQSEILTQLNQRREELTNVEGQLEQARRQQARETVRAPISGRIYNVQATLSEGTVEPGEELLSILPEGDELELSVKVLNRDIGFVREGMRAKVKLVTFPFQEFGTLEGVVTEVSPNAILDRELGLVFNTQVELTENSVTVYNQDVPLTPGMAASAEIVTRQRSILTFLMEPITRRFDEAFSVR